MMPSARRIKRKTTPRVVKGKVQRKNRSAETPDYWNTPQNIPAIDRRKPGPGHRHILTKKDIDTFVHIVPEWDQISIGLHAVILAPAEENTAGWYAPGVVAICAWERELWQVLHHEFFEEHRDILERLSVETEEYDMEPGEYFDGLQVKWTENSIRAYQLIHILMHELGHHHDRMTTPSRRDSGRGESYAEAYARRYEPVIWQRFFEVIPDG